MFKLAADLAKQLGCGEVADHDQRGVVGHVEALVVVVQVLAGHRPQIALGADDAQAVRVLAPGDRLDLFAEPELRKVFAALTFADDHRALGLGLVRLDARVVDAIRLDRQGQVDFRGRQRFEVGGAIDPGEGIQCPTTAGDLLGDLAFAEALAALEQHVLDPVRDARRPRQLVAAADAVPHPYADKRTLADFAQDHAKPVVERRLLEGC